MKIVVLGAGVVGVTTAWYLQKAGHEVTVIDRQPEAGLETSFANGGQISPSHAEPWASPGTLVKVLQWLGKDDAPLVFKIFRYDPALWRWGMGFLRNCTDKRFLQNSSRSLRVAMYSRQCIQELRAETGLQYDHLVKGILTFFRKEEGFEAARKHADFMGQFGLVREAKSGSECLAIEPALATISNQIAGGIYTPEDETGDALKFTQALAKLAAEKGVTFAYDTTIQRIEKERGQISGVITDKGRFEADRYVLALGSFSPLMARDLGLRLPVYPAKGYSITAPARQDDEAKAPFVSITDDENKFVVTRLGDRIRAAGTAEMAGWDNSMTPIRAETLLTKTRGLFPHAAEYDKAQRWCGLRAVTPDSVPLLGGSPIPNLYLNTGHGTLGWTMACGSGRYLADVISGKKPEIDAEGLGLERF